MVLYVKWKRNYTVNFLQVTKTNTDYGFCCLINPYLNFDLNKTGDQIIGTDYHSIPKGTRYGRNYGLKFMIDVETFEQAYIRNTLGFRAIVSDASDKAVDKNGFYIAPGILNPRGPSLGSIPWVYPRGPAREGPA